MTKQYIEFNEKMKKIQAGLIGMAEQIEVAMKKHNHLTLNDQLDELHAAGQVKYIGTDFGYPDLTTGHVYTVLDKVMHPHFNIPVLKILDDKDNENDCSLIIRDSAHLFEPVKPSEHLPIYLEDELTPNEQRRNLIESAKDFYEANDGDAFYWKHDKEKREVSVCEVITSDGRREVTEVTVGCKEGIVFNIDIYKAVALATVLNMDIPDEFLNAVQPDEVVVGMKVHCSVNSYGNASGNVCEVLKRFNGGYLVDAYNSCGIDKKTWVEEDFMKIIDDTNAVYANDTQ